MIYTRNDFKAEHDSVVYDAVKKEFYILKRVVNSSYYVGIPFKITNNFQNLKDCKNTFAENREYGHLVYVDNYWDLISLWKSFIPGKNDFVPNIFNKADAMLKQYMERLVS